LEDGIKLNTDQLVVISIIRAGDSMLDSFLTVCPSVKVGKILIQRDEETALPKLMYYKVPNLAGKQVILLDPMLATGGSAKQAISVLLQHGASIDRLAFFSVISAPEGIQSILRDYPDIRIVTGHQDEGLNEKAYIIPGLGDYGDRYFGTV
jgi:uracil phosphoribosyltransferase